MASPEHGPVFVLIHSPLVGPTTWSPLAEELERRGREAVVVVHRLQDLGPAEVIDDDALHRFNLPEPSQATGRSTVGAS
jgi:hypothetical protein